MPNGRNAGRLFPDCTDEHGFGVYHALPNDWTDPEPGEEKPVKCNACGAQLVAKNDNGTTTLHPTS